MTRVILLAAGASRRFGSQKLLCSFEGRPLWRYAFDAAGETGRPVTVVTRTGLLDGAAAEYGYGLALVPPGLGQGDSVAAGAAAANEREGLCFFVCDQPHLSGGIFRAFLDAYEASGKSMGRVCCGSRMGSPTVFSPAFRSALMSLTGEGGAKALFSGREADTFFYPVPERCLVDYDSPWPTQMDKGLAIRGAT